MVEGRGSPATWRLLGAGYLLVGLAFMALGVVNMVSGVETPFHTWFALLFGIALAGCARLAWWRAAQREQPGSLPSPPVQRR